jgi:hypothetical protein
MRLLVIAIVCVVVVGCSDSPQREAFSAAELLSVIQATFVEDPPGFFEACGPRESRCPLTDRLRQRLTELNSSLCRCDSKSPTLGYTPVEGEDSVSVTLFRGDLNIRLHVKRTADGLRVDDLTCRGPVYAGQVGAQQKVLSGAVPTKPASSIYRTPPVDCLGQE